MLLCAAAPLALVPATASGARGADLLRFRTEVVRDPFSNGIEAFRLLVPRGWVRRGGILWNLRYSNVASIALWRFIR